MRKYLVDLITLTIVSSFIPFSLLSLAEMGTPAIRALLSVLACSGFWLLFFYDIVRIERKQEIENDKQAVEAVH